MLPPVLDCRMITSGRVVEPEEGRVYTAEFRLYGLLHLPKNVGTARMLNLGDRPYLPVTSCMVYGAGYRHPPESDALQYETEFAAVPKDHVLWVVGGRVEDVPVALQRTPRLVYVMYAGYVLTGSLYLTPNQRVSDFLLTALTDRPFHNLHNARVLEPRPDVPMRDFAQLQQHPFVTVNLKRAGGIFDVREGDGGGFRLDTGEI